MNYDNCAPMGVLYFRNGCGDWVPLTNVTACSLTEVDTIDQHNPAEEDLKTLIKSIDKWTFHRSINEVFEFSTTLIHPNKRINYLAKHGKERVRKKNQKRIEKYWSRILQTLL